MVPCLPQDKPSILMEVLASTCQEMDEMVIFLMLVCHPVDPPYRPTDPRCSTSGLTGRSMMREFLKAPVVFGHPNQKIFDFRETPTGHLQRVQQHIKKWTKKWTSQIPPNKNTQPGTRPAPHGVSHPVQEHRPCSDHPNQEDESLGRRTS